MTTINEFVDPCTSEVAGTDVTDSPANLFTLAGSAISLTGTGSRKFNANTYITGQKFLYFNCTAEFALIRKDSASKGGWRNFALRVPASPISTNTIIFSAWNNTTKCLDVRLSTTNTLQVRNATSSTQWTSPTLTAGAEYEVAVKVDQNSVRCKIYTNDGVLIASGDSGVLNTGFTTANPDNCRYGPHGSCTVADLGIGAFRADDSTELTPLSEVVDNAVLTDKVDFTRVDASSSVGTPLTLTQTSGPTSPGITDNGDGTFDVEHPVPFETDMVFDLDAGTSTLEVTITAAGTGAGLTKTHYVKTALGWE